MTGWIFQGNPKKFDVDRYLLQKNNILWLVRPEKFSAKMGVGDKAFIWRSDGEIRGSGGIVAVGSVSGAPALLADDAPGLWHENIASKASVRVGLSISEKRLTAQDGMLPRTSLEEHPVLRNLWIPRWRSQTTYPLSPDEASLLLARWKGFSQSERP
jgi:hypothetical protein